MSLHPTPTPSTSTSPTSTSTSLSAFNNATAKDDHRIRSVVIVLGILGAFLVAYIIYITLRVKRRQESGDPDVMGPYTGRVMNTDHPSSQITPFGAGGPYSGMTIPRFKHTPGEDMRIALRRPDGAWHFADSRTPFTPSGVSDLDILPSPSSTTSLLSHHHRLPIPPLKDKDKDQANGSAKAQEAKAEQFESEFNFGVVPPPPPAYYSEPCREHFDSAR